MSHPRDTTTVFVVSGGVGASAEQVVNTVLAQFPDAAVEVVTFGNVREVRHLEQAVQAARDAHAIVVFTLVDRGLAAELVRLTQQHGVPAIDLVGPLLDELGSRLGMRPVGQPGLYRLLHREYFDRITAMEYTIAHDDGCGSETWHQADLLLLGVSRTGKTPLSIYLSVLGWKVANCPVVPGVALPDELFRLDRRRVIGLTIAEDRLISIRRRRGSDLGLTANDPYVDIAHVIDELEIARRICRRGGFEVLEVTDQPVETTANEVVKRLTHLIGDRRHPPV